MERALAEDLENVDMDDRKAAGDFRDRIYGKYVEAAGATLTGAEVGARPRRAYLVRMVRDHFPADRDAEVVDLGCGDGAFIAIARDLGYHRTWGVDSSPQQVAAAAHRGVAGVRQGDLFATLKDIAPQSVDAFVAFDVIEHLRRDELLVFGDAALRGLRSGGRLLAHVPNAESPLFGRIRYGDFTHEQAFTRKSLFQVFHSVGFSSVICHEDTPVVHGAASAARFVVWKAIRSALRLYLVAETGDTNPPILTQTLLMVATK